MIAETTRLRIRRITLDDAPFILEILNDPAFLEHIGDKNVRTLDEAREYIRNVPLASYERHGFGHYLVELKATAEAIGICSLVKRAWLVEVDLGFAFLPAFRRAGYAYEASAALLTYAHAELGLPRLVAIVSPTNARSIALLNKVGMTFERMVKADDGHDLMLFAEAAVPAANG